MASYTFRWEHPAQEVFVTGTFDDWTKSVHLQHNGSFFEKTVDLPMNQDKIYYKFVVDGHWTPDYNKYHENDGSGNVNNVLHVGDLIQTPKPTEHMPGFFPETPAYETSAPSFGVAPLPPTSGSRNPVDLAPGESVPHPSSYTSNTTDSHVRLDRESYERSDAYPTEAVLPGGTTHLESGAFGVPPANIIPESSLPMGDNRNYSNLDAGPTIQSAGAGTSTAELAGQVPKEPRGVPQVVHESQERAHQPPEASANAEAVMDKKQLEQELLSEVPEEQGVSDSARGFSADSNVPQAVSHSQQLAHQGPEAAAYPDAVVNKEDMENELLQRVPREQANDSYSNEPVSTVPQTVQDSQYEAGEGPEAAGNPEAVSEKQQVENELLSKVPQQNSASDTGSKIGDYAAAGATALGFGGAAATIAHHTQGATSSLPSMPRSMDEARSQLPAMPSSVDEARSQMPKSVQHASNQASSTYEQASNQASSTYEQASNQASSTYEQASTQASSTFQQASNQASSVFHQASSKLPSSLSQATAYLPTSLQHTINDMTGGSNTAHNVPEPVQDSISQSHEPAEAAANPEAVSEKSTVERELLSSISPSQETGEHAPAIGGPHSAGTGHSTARSVPEPVQDSIVESRQSPEAAANPEAVYEKSAVERELLSSISPSQETGEHAPAIGGPRSAGTGHSTAGSVPEPVQDSIVESRRSPEAAANPEAVYEKSAVERELLSSVRPTEEAYEPAPSTSASLSATGPSTSTGKSSSTIAGTSSSTSSGLSRGPADFGRHDLSSPPLLDRDTAPALAAMSAYDNAPSTTGRSADISSSYAGTSSQGQGYSSPQTQSYSTTQYSAPPSQGQTYSTHHQNVIDRVFGASLDGANTGSTSSSAAPLAAAAAAPAAYTTVRAVESEPAQTMSATPTTTSQPSQSSQQSLMSKHAHVQNKTYGGNTLAFQNDPISASSGSVPSATSTTSALDPRTVASAFAQDPVSAAAATPSSLPIRTSSMAAPGTASTSATTGASSRSTVTDPALLAATAATGAAGGRALNAGAANQASTPATQAGADSTVTTQKPISMPKTLRQPPVEDSRDVSPMNAGSKPTVTTGVASQTTPAKTEARSPPSPLKQNPASGSASASPSKAPPASGPRLDIPGEKDTKNTKRRSFFGKLKDKLGGKEQDEADLDKDEDEDIHLQQIDGAEEEDEIEEEEEEEVAVAEPTAATVHLEPLDQQGIMGGGGGAGDGGLDLGVKGKSKDIGTGVLGGNKSGVAIGLIMIPVVISYLWLVYGR